jgi:hypothetical protein
MTDNINKSIIIPYGQNIGLNDTKFSIFNANKSKNITITKGTIIPYILNADWNTYLPTVPKTLSVYLNGGANPTTELNTLFHYFTILIQGFSSIEKQLFLC